MKIKCIACGKEEEIEAKEATLAYKCSMCLLMGGRKDCSSDMFKDMFGGAG